MTDLRAIFNAGRVRRWHTHPVMSQYDDFNDGHQGRVARLALALFPDDAVLLRAFEAEAARVIAHRRGRIGG